MWALKAPINKTRDWTEPASDEEVLFTFSFKYFLLLLSFTFKISRPAVFSI